jgi:hypothetical protein
LPTILLSRQDEETSLLLPAELLVRESRSFVLILAPVVSLFRLLFFPALHLVSSLKFWILWKSSSQRATEAFTNFFTASSRNPSRTLSVFKFIFVFSFLLRILPLYGSVQGATVVAKTISFTKNEKGEEDFKPEVYRLTRSDNDYEYLEFVSYSPLFDKLDLEKIIQIFECLLYERRIIICSKTLSTLSACADAIANLAYPLAWQYVFIPILPKSMMSFLGAPMPFLIGILSSYIPLIEREPIEDDVLIIDIDENRFIRTPSTQDEIPQSLKSSLQKTLKKIIRSGTSTIETA